MQMPPHVPCMSPNDGLLTLRDAAAKEFRVPVAAGDAFAMAMRFSLPVLLDARFAIQAAKVCLDRVRLEHLLCDEGDESCDQELAWLSERLDIANDTTVSSARVASLLEEIEPFARYWAEHLRLGSRTLSDFQENLSQLKARTSGII